MLLKITNEDGTINPDFSGKYQPLDENHKRAGYIKNSDSVQGNTIVYNSVDKRVDYETPGKTEWDNIIIQLTGEVIATDEYFTVFALKNEFGFKVYLERVGLVGNVYDNEFENVKWNGMFTRYEVVDHVHNTISYENIKESASATLDHVYELLEPFIVYNPSASVAHLEVRGTMVGSPKQTVKRIHYEDQHGGGGMSDRTVNGQDVYAGYSINSDVNDPDEDPPDLSASCNSASVMPVKCVQNCDTLGRLVGTEEGSIDFTDRTKKYWVIREELPVSVDKFHDADLLESGNATISGYTSDQEELSKDTIRNTLNLPNYNEWDYWMQARYPFFDENLFIEDPGVLPTIISTTDDIYRTPLVVQYKCGQVLQEEWMQTSYTEQDFQILAGSVIAGVVDNGFSEEDFLDSDGIPYPETGTGSGNSYGRKSVSSWASGGRLDDHAMFVYFMLGTEDWRANINAPHHVENFSDRMLYGNLEGGSGTVDSVAYRLSNSKTTNNVVSGPEAWDNSNPGHINTVEFGTGWYLNANWGAILYYNPSFIGDVPTTGPDAFRLTFRKVNAITNTGDSGNPVLVDSNWTEWKVRVPTPNNVNVSAVPAFHRYPLVLNGSFYNPDGGSIRNSGDTQFQRGSFTNGELRLHTASGTLAHDWAKAELWKSLARVTRLSGVVDAEPLDDQVSGHEQYTTRDDFDWEFNHANKADTIDLVRVALGTSSMVMAVKRQTVAVEATQDAFEDETLPQRAEIIYPPDAIDDLGYDSIISDVPDAIDDLGYDSIISDQPDAIDYLEAVAESRLSAPMLELGDILSDTPGLIYLNDPEVVDPRSIGCVVYTVNVIDQRKEWCGVTQPSKYKGFVFDERIDGLAGPFADSYITAITTKDNTAEMIAVDQDKGLLKTDLRDFNEQKFPLTPDLDQVYQELNTRMDQTGLEKGVVCSRIGEGFSYRGIFQQFPFSETSFGYGCVQDPLFFRDSTLAVVESNWIHLGDEHNEKQVHRIDLSFHKNSFGALWGYVCNEEGEYKGQYKGEVQEHMKVFTNLRGRRFKTKLFIVTHPQYPWALREMSLGHLYGKSF